jgi:hypothetical protein
MGGDRKTTAPSSSAVEKNFDNSARKDYSSFAWEAAVRWSPLTYSVFDFVTSKTPSESTGVGDAVIGKLYSATWSHAWSSRLRSQVLASYRADDFLDATPNRNDDTATFGARLKYDFRRWLILGAEYTHTNRDSNQGIYDYKRNLYLLTVGATL